jgi:hypothetical protein
MLSFAQVGLDHRRSTTDLDPGLVRLINLDSHPSVISSMKELLLPISRYTQLGYGTSFLPRLDHPKFGTNGTHLDACLPDGAIRYPSKNGTRTCVPVVQVGAFCALETI